MSSNVGNFGDSGAEQIKRMVDKMTLPVNPVCSRCGSAGIHACSGHRIEWTDEDVALLRAALYAYGQGEDLPESEGGMTD